MSTKIKTLSVTVTYSVGLEDLSIPENVYQELLQAAEEDSTITPDGVEYGLAAFWLFNNITQDDGYKWAITIDELTPPQEEVSTSEVFTCRACGHELPRQFNVKTEGFCYLCDPAVTLEECLNENHV